MQSEIYSYLKRNKVINPQVLVSVTEQAVEDKYWNKGNCIFQAKKIVVPSSLPENGVDEKGVYWYQMPDGGFGFSFEVDDQGKQFDMKNELFFYGMIGQMTTGGVPQCVITEEKINFSEFKANFSLGMKSNFGENGAFKGTSAYLTFLNEEKLSGIFSLNPDAKLSQLYSNFDATKPRKVINCGVSKGGNHTTAGYAPGSTFYFYTR